MFTEQNGDLLHAEADMSMHHHFGADSQGGQAFGDFFHAYVEQIVRSVLESQQAQMAPQQPSIAKRASRVKEKKPRVMPADLGLTRREVEHMAALPSTAETLAGREASHLDELSQARGLAAREVRRTGALRTDAEQILTVERGQPPRLGVAFEVLLELWRREADFEAWRRPPPIKP